MDAVIFNGPYNIGVEHRPIPTIRDPNDAIVKVEVAGICGSELHMYRGHQSTATGHIMGHEFVGTVQEIGSAVNTHRIGDRVVSIFSVTCNECWFCRQKNTNRCVHGAAFGTQMLDGGQAEFVRVPYANGTLKPLPTELDASLGIMMSDILPTGYYGTMRALDGYLQSRFVGQSTSAQRDDDTAGMTMVCIGCGPVGLCAILTARHKGVARIYAIDSIQDRLEKAKCFGAIPLKLGQDDIQGTIMAETDGRGADAVVELVGNTAALRSAFDMLRPSGTLSSIGFHQGDLPFTALECYQKNLNTNFGRAAVGAVFDDSLKVLLANKQDLLDLVTHRLLLSEAADGFAMFEKQLAQKVVLVI